MKLLIATTNQGKRDELAALLYGLPFNIVTPADLDINMEVDETGTSYNENAIIKAEAFCKISGLTTLADDTGLEVDALDGRPGLHSARYVEALNATDADRRAKLLQELALKPHPWKAHFHCSVAVAHPALDTIVFEGNAYGQIVAEERGEFGFGYDSLMVLNGVGKTLAEMRMGEKNLYSHRSAAVKAAIPYLLKISKLK
jgi:XTP/dITP diphosphohydrolase